MPNQPHQIQDKSVLSSDFEWTLDRNEFAAEVDPDICEMAYYDIRKAKELIRDNPRPVEFRDLEPYIDAILADAKLRPNVNWDLIGTDLPVIVGQKEGGKFPIDGRHRFKRAMQLNMERFPLVALTVEETKAITLTSSEYAALSAAR